MIRVAIETATRWGSVAVARDDRLLAEVTLGVQTRHAESALPGLDAALRLAGVDRSAIGEVVVGAGPGSFTGVRVAGAMAKGLATALKVPLLSYSSLLALAVDAAAGAPSDAAICGLFDARRGEVYGGCWRVGPGTAVSEEGAREPGAGGSVPLARVMAPRVGPVESVAYRLAETLNDSRVAFVGEGVVPYRRQLADAALAAGLDARFAALTARPRASGLLWLAQHHGDEGLVEDVASWEPAYVRGSSAERGVAG